MRIGRRISAVAAAAILLAACDDTEPKTESAYCGEIAANLAELSSPPITTADDIRRVLRAWEAVADAAPVAVEAEWDTMVDAMKTAITVDPNEPESLQKVADTARASEPAAKRVVSYTQERCGITIGIAP